MVTVLYLSRWIFLGLLLGVLVRLGLMAARPDRR